MQLHGARLKQAALVSIALPTLRRGRVGPSGVCVFHMLHGVCRVLACSWDGAVRGERSSALPAKPVVLYARVDTVCAAVRCGAAAPGGRGVSGFFSRVFVVCISALYPCFCTMYSVSLATCCHSCVALWRRFCVRTCAPCVRVVVRRRASRVVRMACPCLFVSIPSVASCPPLCYTVVAVEV